MEQTAIPHKLRSTGRELIQPVTNLESIREPASFQESVTSLFHDQLQVDVAAPDVDLFETGILDSLKTAELLNCLETRFGIDIDLDDLEFNNFRSIAGIVQFLRDRTCNRQEGT